MNDFMKIIGHSPESAAGGKLYPRAILNHYDTEEAALADREDWKQTLAGKWNFNFYHNPADVRMDAEPENQIDVPGCWDMQGFGYPHYTNVQMPFHEFPPETPEYNPTGVYTRTFSVPKNWKGRRVVLHFDGVENCFFPYLNGKLLGYSKDSRGVTEFDITDSLAKKGENELKIVVIQYSDAAFVEDQDQWWHGGIVRNVWIHATPRNRLEDVFATATLDDRYSDGLLTVETAAGLLPVKKEGAKLQEGWSFRVKLLDLQGKTVAEKTVPAGVVENCWYGLNDPNRMTSTCRMEIPGVEPWSAENPRRYLLLVSLLDGTKVVDSTTVKIGFRRVEIKHRQLLINGKAVLITGVNRHEHDSRSGRTLSKEHMLRDVMLMKQFNVNAVRTSHYPDDPYFYELCDEYGLYVFDETNLETHAYYSDLCHNPAWGESFLYRAVNLVTRDKNHPCVIVWSLGNESGVGVNHAAISAWIRRFDPSRPIHYEGAVRHWTPNVNREMMDFISPMYPSLESIENWAETGSSDDRPLIMCEFSHAMGNSNGGLKDYFHAFRTHYGLQGGFIWEWCDHGIYKKNKNGKEFLAYGGDFGEPMHDYNFVTDGLVSPDRVPHPGLYEYKYLSQPAEMELVDPATSQLSIRNRRYFTGLSDCELKWELSVNGTAVQNGRADVPELGCAGIAPLFKENENINDTHKNNVGFLKLDYTVPEDLRLGDVCTLTVRLTLKDATKWAPAGHEVAHEQFQLPCVTARLPEPLRFKLPDLAAEKDKSLNIAGLLKGGTLNIWRPTIDNDCIKNQIFENKPSRASKSWFEQGFDKLTLVRSSGKKDDVEFVYKTATGKKIIHRRTIRPEENGMYRIANTFEVGETITDLPRLGLIFALPSDFAAAEYFGFGPFENHRDRDAACILGKFGVSADDPSPYIMPQEYGSRGNVRSLEVTNGKRTILILPEFPMEFSLRRYSIEELQKREHEFELVQSDCVWLNLDLYQRGVGTGSCGPDTYPRYRTLNAGTYRFHFRIAVR